MINLNTNNDIPNVKILFIVVADKQYFIGCVAAVNSILNYHPSAEIAIIDYSSNNENGLTSYQKNFLTQKNNIKIYNNNDFNKDSRVTGAWQYKTYSMSDMLQSNLYDIIIGIDSDCYIVSNLNDIISQCLKDGKIRGGKDGKGQYYDSSYNCYGIKPNTLNNKYMSTSIYFVPNNDINKAIFNDASIYTNTAIYGPQTTKIYPGHGDQGVLNATIFKHTNGDNVDLLDNELWSMHWVFDQIISTYNNGEFINKSFQNLPIRAVHTTNCKIWTKDYNKKYNINQEWLYAEFLNFLFLGTLCLVKDKDFTNIVGSEYNYLMIDLINNKDKIIVLNKDLFKIWDNISYEFINLLFSNNKLHRMMPLHSESSMHRYINLVKSLPNYSKILEIGSYRGGSILTLALATFYKFFDYHSIESFMGNEDNTVDGWELPKISDYLYQTKQIFPFLNIKTHKISSINGSLLFPELYFDFIFIDGNHSAENVYEDIQAWMPKLKYNGIIAGDDFSWGSVRKGLENTGYTFYNGNDLWWIVKKEA